MAVSIDGSGSITGIDQGFNVTGGIQVGTGATINGSTNIITALTNGSERLRITGIGSVGIGNTNPGQLLTVGAITGGADGNLSVKTNSNYHAIAIEENSGNENYQLGVNSSGDLGFYNSGATTATVTFADNDKVGIGTAAPQEKLHVSGGNIGVDGGYGIDFSEQTVGGVSDVTVSSELFVHYEEGTFLPFITASSSAPTVSYSAAERGGKYTRIGNIVFYSLGFQMNGYSGGSGNVYIGGFPYVGSGNPGWDGAHTFRDCSAIAINSRINQLRGWIDTSAVSGYPILYIQYQSNTSNFAADALQASSVSVGRITVHGHYKVG